MTDFIIHKSNGQLSNTKKLKQFLEDAEDGRYLVKIQSYNKRTLPMNSYLHGVLIPEFRNALNSVGYNEVRNDEQAKEIMKAMFLKTRVVNEQTGEVIEYTKKTSDLTTLEMSALFDEVIRFAAENMNYGIAYPNEQLEVFKD